jgi:hypothetical protein
MQATHWSKSECDNHVDSVAWSVDKVPSTADEMRRALASAMERARNHFGTVTGEEWNVRATAVPNNRTIQQVNGRRDTSVDKVELDMELHEIERENLAKGALPLPLVLDPAISRVD